MDYIYIDESGDLGKNSNYFVIGAIIVKDSKHLDRIINRIKRNHKKELGSIQELKGHKLKKSIKKKLLKEINKLNAKIIIVVLDKLYKYKFNYNNNYNLLYDLIASELSKKITINSNTSIIIDKSKTKEKHILMFNKLFLSNLTNVNDLKVNIIHGDSINYKGLQVIDLLVWSVFQSVENDNDEFIELIENKIIKRIFED